MHLKLAPLLLAVCASSAHAWQAVVQISCETTIRGMSETSSAASRADRNEDRRNDRLNQYSQSGECRTDSDCANPSEYCEVGKCVLPVASAPVEGSQPLPGCTDDSQCSLGYMCSDTQCVPRTSPPAPAVPDVNVRQCASEVQCTPGQSCVNGRCISPPPLPPSTSLQRRGSEVYLRERATQLRQDLALGEGPVLVTLALERKVPPQKLGRVLRAHRAELRALVGDVSDATWPSRFLDKLDALVGAG